MYEDQLVKLYCGDAGTILPEIPRRSVDFIFTDPPYERIYAPDGATTSRPTRPIAGTGAESDHWAKVLFWEAVRVLKLGAWIACCAAGGNTTQPYRWIGYMDEAGLANRKIIVWDKVQMGMGYIYRHQYESILVGQVPGGNNKWYGGRYVSDVVRVMGGCLDKASHPTVKPVALVQRFLSWHTLPGDLVLDPFAGSGSTLVAAKSMGRRAIGIEIDRRWCVQAARRLAQVTVPEAMSTPTQIAMEDEL